MARKYKVAEGVETVNGSPVPGNRLVELEPEQALYDLAHGRITPARGEKGGSGDGGN